VDTAGDLPHLIQHAGDLFGGARQAALQPGRCLRLHLLQVEDQRYQLLLGAVVQVTLDPPPGLMLSTRKEQVGQPSSQSGSNMKW
jgi:hypothetical protein